MRQEYAVEVVARWLWGKEYSESRLSSIDYYAQLSPTKQALVNEFLKDLTAALRRDQKLIQRARIKKARPFGGMPIGRRSR